MSNLTETAAATKKLGLFLIIAGIVYIVFVFTSGVVKSFWSAGHPPPKPGPEIRFGQLTPLHLVGLKMVEGNSPEYILETLSGNLPSFPETAKVYALIPFPTSLLYEDHAKSLAVSLGFLNPPERLTKLEYLWINENEARLTMHLVTENFKLRANPDKLNFRPGQLTTASQAINQAQVFFGNKGLLERSFTGSSQTVTFLTRREGRLVKASSPETAEVSRVDYFRFLTEGADKFPLLGQNPKKGITRIYLLDNSNNYFAADFNEWLFETKNGSTYPLKSVNEAWNELISGQGYIVYLSLLEETDADNPGPLPSLKTITIREVSLAYYDDENMQNFLQPIYVFKGEAELTTGGKSDLTAYVPAIPKSLVVE